MVDLSIAFCKFTRFLPIFRTFSGRGVPEDHVGGGHVGPGAICRSAASLGAAEPLLPATGAGVRSGSQLLGGLPVAVTFMVNHRKTIGKWWFNGVFMWFLCGLMGFYSDLMGFYSDLMGFYSDLMGY